MLNTHTAHRPLVSVVTPVHNAAAFLAQTVEAVCQQTFADWELLLVDDGSSDGSLQLCRQLAATDARIKVTALAQKSGPAKARNTAIELAEGRYIAFCDSDDVWLHDKLEKQLTVLGNSDAAICFSSYFKMEEDGTRTGRVVAAPPRVTYAMMLRSCSIGCSTAIYDTARCGKVLMPDIQKRQDYGLWLSILQKGHTAIGLHEPLVHYRLRKDSISANKLKAAHYHWNVLRVVAGVGRLQAAWLFAQYAWLGLRKYMI